VNFNALNALNAFNTMTVCTGWHWVLISLIARCDAVAMATAEMSAAAGNIEGAIAEEVGLPSLLASQLVELLGPRLAALDQREAALLDASRAQGRMLAAQSRTIAALQSELKELENPGGTMSQQQAPKQGRRQMQSQTCGEPVDQSMMVQAMALISDARDRLTAAKSQLAGIEDTASNGVDDLAIQLTALSEHAGTTLADLRTTSDNFMALEGLLYDALPDTIGAPRDRPPPHSFDNANLTAGRCHSYGARPRITIYCHDPLRQSHPGNKLIGSTLTFP
jgi:hypothetical protein